MRPIVLASGGLDSFLCWYLFCQDSINIFVDIGHKYARKEEKALKNLQDNISNFNVLIHKGSDIGIMEEENFGIIPNRNAELILSASQYGNKIYFGVIKDEINSDKSPEFINAITEVLNISNKKQYWTNGKLFQILTPTREYNKTELIRKYIDHGGSIKHLNLTISCYNDHEQHCGDCPSCFKRWVAFRNNNIPFNTLNDPMDFAYKKGIIKKCKDGTYSKDRANEIMNCIKNNS